MPDFNILYYFDISDAGDKEAVIKFDTETAASTACLLNNALIDGANVRVEMFPSAEEKEAAAADSNAKSQQKSPSPQLPSISTSSFGSFFSSVAASSIALAQSAAESIKSIDEQYKVTETVAIGATTAWSETKRVAQNVDEKYRVRENVSSAAAAAKVQAASLASVVSEKVGSVSGGSAGGSVKGSPRMSPRPASPEK